LKKLGKGCNDWKLNQGMKDKNDFVISAQEINIYVINAFVKNLMALQLSMYKIITG